ncbi:ras-related protein Rab-24 isoform X2 [Pungitius pungitius]|uniref:ras-related protein Rab-24 isoform X2 n=2 Tax=Pungitius pungitius TaxID=134920 RepID=UPI002E0E0B89
MSAMRVDAKVVMLGKESVGKTSLVERYVHHRFLVGPYQNTIGAAFVAKPIQVGEKVITLGIWDTAGSERYEAMSRIYYRGARAAIVCYDMTDTSSFRRARFWVKELQNCEEHCKIYLCGTKSDLIQGDRSLRQIDHHDAQDFADEIGALHFETSSKTGNHVGESYVQSPRGTLSARCSWRKRAVPESCRGLQHQRLPVYDRGDGSGPGPEEGLLFLLLLP